MYQLITMLLSILVPAAVIGIIVWAVLWPYIKVWEENFKVSPKMTTLRAIVGFWTIFIAIAYLVLGSDMMGFLVPLL